MRDAKTIVIILLALALILSLVLRPKPGPSKEQIEREMSYKRQRAIDSTDLAQNRAQMNVLISDAKEARKVDSVKLRAKESEIQRLKVKAAKKVVEIPVQAHQDYPQIQEALNAKDSVITSQDSLITTLRDVNYRSLKDFDALSIAIVDERKISEKMLQDCETNRESLKRDVERDVKRERRKTALFKVVAVVGTIGAFLLGNSY